jgi:hypothetical protein
LTPRGHSARYRHTPENHPDKTTPSKSRASAAMCGIPRGRRGAGFGTEEWGVRWSAMIQKNAAEKTKGSVAVFSKGSVPVSPFLLCFWFLPVNLLSC